jgi:hypothetical protein
MDSLTSLAQPRTWASAPANQVGSLVRYLHSAASQSPTQHIHLGRACAAGAFAGQQLGDATI